MSQQPDFSENNSLEDPFMVFALDPILDKSELNLTHASSIVIKQPAEFKLGEEFNYRFCDAISQICGSGNFQIIPKTDTVIIDFKEFCNIASKYETILSTLADDLEITKLSSLEQAERFFQTKNVLVQSTGMQGMVYKIGSYLQSAGSAGLVTHTLGLARIAGVTGLPILEAQPALLIAIPAIGAIFCYGCGALIGNNVIGKTFVTVGDVLALPMRGFEMMWNSYGNPLIQRVFGIPIIFNMTQSFKTGPGYTFNEIRKYIPLNKTSLLKSVKNKLINWFS